MTPHNPPLLVVGLFYLYLVNVTLVLATQRLPGPRTYGPLLTASALGGVAGGLVSHRITARIAMLPTVLLALARAVPADLVCG